jgi:hypothetical protein
VTSENVYDDLNGFNRFTYDGGPPVLDFGHPDAQVDVEAAAALS